MKQFESYATKTILTIEEMMRVINSIHADLQRPDWVEIELASDNLHIKAPIVPFASTVHLKNRDLRHAVEEIHRFMVDIHKAIGTLERVKIESIPKAKNVDIKKIKTVVSACKFKRPTKDFYCGVKFILPTTPEPTNVSVDVIFADRYGDRPHSLDGVATEEKVRKEIRRKELPENYIQNIMDFLGQNPKLIKKIASKPLNISGLEDSASLQVSLCKVQKKSLTVKPNNYASGACEVDKIYEQITTLQAASPDVVPSILIKRGYGERYIQDEEGNLYHAISVEVYSSRGKWVPFDNHGKGYEFRCRYIIEKPVSPEAEFLRAKIARVIAKGKFQND